MHQWRNRVESAFELRHDSHRSNGSCYLGVTILLKCLFIRHKFLPVSNPNIKPPDFEVSDETPSIAML